MNAPSVSRAPAPFIKICGMTTPEAVESALACGVDAIGFVFAASVRNVSTRRARELAATARQRAACVAVTRHPTREQVSAILREFDPDILQTDIEDLDGLDLPRTLAVLPVMRPGADAACALPRRVLFEGPTSGSGQTTDWRQAEALARKAQVILAGGLNPGNVAAAIRGVRPYGVDVSSGVELIPGVKSPQKIEQFVAAARAAALESA
ncbi:MAG TPA: phosphoribosylanthranilate isomerase [Steroidobacteraceae bacterium]|nr:phosphoribosylanthranilate isomerase [Steroidobacteraceae bacterium]